MYISKYIVLGYSLDSYGYKLHLTEIFVFNDNKAAHTYVENAWKLSIQKFPHFQAPLQPSISIWKNTSFLKRFHQKLTCNLS